MKGWYVAMDLVSVVFHGIKMLMIASAQDMAISTVPSQKGKGHRQRLAACLEDDNVLD